MRTIILSSDDGATIKNYPYVAWAWNQLGWNTHLFYLGRHSVLMDEFKKIRKHFDTDRNNIHSLSQMDGYSNGVVLQISKLFGGFCYWDDRILMTGDITMLPIKDFWDPKSDQIQFDKSVNRYLAMSATNWRKKIETANNTMIDMEIKLLLDSQTDFKDKEEVNRMICLNNIIMKKVSDNTKSVVIQDLIDTPDSAHIKLNDSCTTEHKNTLKEKLKANFKKLPLWI